MRKFYFLVSVFGLIICNHSFAQTRYRDNMLNLSYGWGSSSQLFDIGVSAQRKLGTDLVYPKTGYGIGCFTLGYQFNYYHRWALGVSLSYEQLSGNLYGKLFGDEFYAGHFDRQVFSFMPEMRWNYNFNRDRLVYAYLSTGVSYVYESSSNRGTLDNYQILTGYLNYQISPLCFRWGGKSAVTLELGVGYKGFANLGWSYNFRYY